MRILVLLLLAAVAGCSSSRSDAGGSTMQEHERSFDPSRYRTRPQPDASQREPAAPQRAGDDADPGSGGSAAPSSDAPVTIQRSDRVMGYRVQVFSTTDAGEATRKRDDMRTLYPDMPADLVFHAPYYKVRLGNFEGRAEADSCRAQMQARGCPEAWVVRDMVTRTRQEAVGREGNR